MLALDRQELNRLRHLANGQSSNFINKKVDLKHRSDERVSKWPNTLDAIRKKKESFLIERAKEKETYLQRIDQEELEHRRQEREDAITRAEKLILDQTNQMRTLRSHALYADILDTRSDQIAEKSKRLAKERSDYKSYQELLKRQLEEANKLEQLKAEKLAEDIKLVTITRAQQLKEANQRKKLELEESRKVGEALKEQFHRDCQVNLLRQVEEAERVKQTNAELTRYNENLRLIRDEIRRKEEEAQLAREKEIDIIENRNLGRKLIDKERHLALQRKRQQLIDAATLQLQQSTNREDEILQKQEQDIKEKYDKQEFEKRFMLEQDWNETLRSRRDQIEGKAAQRRQQDEQDAKLIEAWHRENKLELDKEAEKQKQARQFTTQLKTREFEKGQQLQRLKQESEAVQKQIESNQLKAESPIDVAFVKACETEITVREEKGKAVYPLKVALATVKQI